MESTSTAFDTAPTSRKRSRITCAVCCESFRDTQVVECGCGFNACRACIKRFLLGTSLDAHCMNCDKHWGTDVLVELLGKTFTYGEWKRWREQVLLDREISMLPETVEHAAREKRRQEARAQVDILKNKKKELMKEVGNINRAIYRAENQVDRQVQPPAGEGGVPTTDEGGVPLAQEPEAPAFVQACAADGCGGFLSTAWKCQMCKGYSCSKCGEFCGDDRRSHVCTTANLETMKAIRADATRCPGCGIYVHKVFGCSQMYCTACHTSFDYRTGKRLTGLIHNPHYFEYMRNGNVALFRDRTPCGGAVTVQTLQEFFRVVRLGLNAPVAISALNVKHSKLKEVLFLNAHLTRVEMPRYHHQLGEADNRDLRIRLLNGDIDRNAMKVVLQQREKKRIKKGNIHMILHMFVTTSHELISQLVTAGVQAGVNERIDSTVAEVEALIEYVNNEFRKIGRSCNSSRPMIEYSRERYSFTTVPHTTLAVRLT